MTTRRTTVLGAVLAVALGVTLAACGSSSPKGPLGSGDKASDSTHTTDKGGGDSSSDFDAKPKAPIRVTYKSGDGTTMTLSWNGTNSAYITDDGKYITTKDSVIMCDADSGCVKTPNTAGSDGAAGSFAGLFTMLGGLKDSQPNLFTDKSSATIAGRSATCVTFDGSKFAGLSGDADAETGKAQFCWDNKTGVLLRLKTTDTSSSDSDENLEAADVGEPKDDDFQPSGPVKDMSNLMTATP